MSVGRVLTQCGAESEAEHVFLESSLRRAEGMMVAETDTPVFILLHQPLFFFNAKQQLDLAQLLPTMREDDSLVTEMPQGDTRKDPRTKER